MYGSMNHFSSYANAVLKANGIRSDFNSRVFVPSRENPVVKDALAAISSPNPTMQMQLRQELREFKNSSKPAVNPFA
jgi:hypothetical protein